MINLRQSLSSSRISRPPWTKSMSCLFDFSALYGLGRAQIFLPFDPDFTTHTMDLPQILVGSTLEGLPVKMWHTNVMTHRFYSSVPKKAFYQ